MPRRREPLVHRAFGARIRTLRRARGFTQEQLAHAVALQPPAISRIESGQLGVSLTTAALLAGALGTELAELFRTDPLPPPDERLDAEERALLSAWRRLDGRARGIIRVVIGWADEVPRSGRTADLLVADAPRPQRVPPLRS